MIPKLGYAPIRGMAEPIRYLLRYVGVKYEEEKYPFGPPPLYDRPEWSKAKFTKGLDFPNLPYYIDDDVKITQSVAILRYLARKHGLMVSSEEDAIQQDIVEQQAADLRMQLGFLIYDPQFEKKKDEYIKNLPTRLKTLSDFLGEKQWMLGDKLTYVDFMIYETIDLHRFLAPDCAESFPNLKDYMDRFENLPAIASYRGSSSFVKWPLFSPFARFGGK